MRPKPITPRVLPNSSRPSNSFFNHLPAFIEASARGSSRTRLNIKLRVSSATATVVANGEFTTVTWCAFAAARSMLSTPTPALPTTFKWGAAANTDSVTLVRPRTIRASYCPTTFKRSSALIPDWSVTSAADRKISFPFSSNPSVNSTFQAAILTPCFCIDCWGKTPIHFTLFH